jgi:hypothetical protein
MNLEVIWLQEAEDTFNQNLEYLEREWPPGVRLAFIERVKNVLTIISNSPNQYPIYRKKDLVRKCVVHPRITLYFKVKDQRIFLLTFWNNYRDPKKLKL